MGMPWRPSAASRTVGLLDGARLIYERGFAGAGQANVSAEKLLRIASLLTAFATVYIRDDEGSTLRPLGTAELAGAAVGTDGALVFSDGRPPLPNPVILEESIGELAERLARLGILRRIAD
jgi:hypothetical protein